jgi:predicted RNA polymerase sigma factor
MPPPVPEQLSRTIQTLYRSESGRVLATLVRLLGDLDLTEGRIGGNAGRANRRGDSIGTTTDPTPTRAGGPKAGNHGLLALMLLQESRRTARTSPAGELILLENQDHSLWNRQQIAGGVALGEKALNSCRFGAYTLQPAIAAVNAEAESTAATNWRQLVALYNQVVRIHPSPVAHLNHAMANCHARRPRGRSGAYRRGLGTCELAAGQGG